jgi:OFA family oxalate/formate antiporter-like MFS transporter
MTKTRTSTNRWGIAAAGFLMQMALGAVYAWSVFRVPLAKQFRWSIEEVTLTFTISIFVLGVACFFGGLWLNKRGPRDLATLATSPFLTNHPDLSQRAYF